MLNQQALEREREQPKFKVCSSGSKFAAPGHECTALRISQAFFEVL